MLWLQGFQTRQTCLEDVFGHVFDKALPQLMLSDLLSDLLRLLEVVYRTGKTQAPALDGLNDTARVVACDDNSASCCVPLH